VGIFTVVNQKKNYINNIHVWPSAFIKYASVMLENFPNNGQEYLKYMQTVRMAASRGVNGEWVQYDEQFRLRKARYPISLWGVVDMELWLLCVATPKFSTVQRPFNTGLVNQHSQQSFKFHFLLVWYGAAKINHTRKVASCWHA
jgi:hypothetical protein